MLHQRQQGSSRRISVGADKAYDTADFVAAAREIDVTQYVKKDENGRRPESTRGPPTCR